MRMRMYQWQPLSGGSENGSHKQKWKVVHSPKKRETTTRWIARARTHTHTHTHGDVVTLVTSQVLEYEELLEITGADDVDAWASFASVTDELHVSLSSVFRFLFR
jgi:hypothetical protein